MEKILRLGEKIIPRPLYNFGQPIYHGFMATASAIVYRFPSKKIKIIAVTGTKGKSSTTEIINAMLEEAGYKTAVSNTIRFKIGNESTDNMYKMSMPGRFFIQRFLRQAVTAGCDFVVMEMTSQGSAQFRHKFIDLEALVFTNLSPEHIESHGSYKNYLQAKLNISKNVKATGAIIANADDKESPKFLACKAEKKITYSVRDAEPYTILPEGIDFTIANRKAHSPLSGLFNLYNILGAAAAVRNFGVTDDIIIRAVEKFSGIKGRVEKIIAGQDFTVVVDYAHTTDSMEKLFQVFESSRIIAVFGATGGGRDKWKRKDMGSVADKYAEEIILTDDDSYDEDPNQITKEIAAGITDQTPTILIDRREAIAEAFKRARTGDTVLIIGKGTDPYLMGPNGKKTPWSDAQVAREELKKRAN